MSRREAGKSNEKILPFQVGKPHGQWRMEIFKNDKIDSK